MDEIKKEEPQVEMMEHTVTEEDMINNPEFVAEGMKIGDTIQIPKDATEEDAKLEQAINENLGLTGTEEEVSSVIEAAPIAPEKKRFYMGKLIISQFTRELDDKNYQHVRVEDGSEYDLNSDDVIVTE